MWRLRENSCERNLSGNYIVYAIVTCHVLSDTLISIFLKDFQRSQLFRTAYVCIDHSHQQIVRFFRDILVTFFLSYDISTLIKVINKFFNNASLSVVESRAADLAAK